MSRSKLSYTFFMAWMMATGTLNAQNWPLQVKGLCPTITPTQEGGVLVATGWWEANNAITIVERRDSEGQVVWSDTSRFGPHLTVYPSHLFLHDNGECTFIALDNNGLRFIRYAPDGERLFSRYLGLNVSGIEFATTVIFESGSEEFLVINNFGIRRISYAGEQISTMHYPHSYDGITQFGRKIGLHDPETGDMILYIIPGYVFDQRALVRWDPETDHVEFIAKDSVLVMQYSVGWWSQSQGNTILLKDSTFVTSHIKPVGPQVLNPIIQVQQYVNTGELINSFEIELFEQPFFQDDSDLWADSDSTLILSLGSTWCRVSMDGEVFNMFHEPRPGGVYGIFEGHHTVVSDTLGFSFFAYQGYGGTHVVRRRLDVYCPPVQYIDTTLTLGETFNDLTITRDTVVADTLYDDFTGCTSVKQYFIRVQTTAIHDNAATGTSVRIVPNPVSDDLMLTISGDLSSGHYSITNLYGRQVMSGTFRDTQHMLSVASLPPGGYFLQIEGIQLPPVAFVKLP